MFDSSESLLAKLYSQALVDIDLYSRMYKRKIFNHYYSRVKQLA